MRSSIGTALWLLLPWVLWVQCPYAFALNPALEINQYAHTAWRIRDGFAGSHIHAIAQTPDGFVWLGTDLGLLRFDGERTTKLQPPSGEATADLPVRILFTDRSGALWIGGQRGLAKWNQGRLTTYPELAAWTVNGLAEDRKQTVWVGAQSPTTGNLCAITKQRMQCYHDNPFGAWVNGVHVDLQDNLWVTAATGLWRWQSDSPRHYSTPESVASNLYPLTETSAGEVLVLTTKGVRQIVDGNVRGYWAPENKAGWHPNSIFADGDGDVWIGSQDEGLFHIHENRVDQFDASDGLSGNSIYSMLNDREGNVWVVTDQGLDRFHRFWATTYAARQGIIGFRDSIIADRDGSIWFSTDAGLYHWRATGITFYGNRDRSSFQPSVRETAARNALSTASIRRFPDSRGASLFQDHRGRIWLGTTSGLGYLDGDRFVSIHGVPPGYIDSIVEDWSNNLWIAHRDAGLFEVSSDQVEQQIPWSKIGRSGYALRLLGDQDGHGLWLGFASGGIVHLVDGREVAAYGRRQGLGEGQVNELRRGSDGSLWVATAGGVSRLRTGRIATLDVNHGLPCNNVDSSIETEGGLWLYTSCGLVRIVASDARLLDTLPDSSKLPRVRVPVTVLDYTNGIPTLFAVATFSPHVARTADGKLWFVTQDGLTVVDPRHLALNYLPPPVSIERMIADRVSFDALSQVHLPPLGRDLRIDYTALSLVAPEKNQFRYKLEGHDRDWQDVGNRRQAFYSDLPPGNYQFRVIASNNSGVWNKQGASVTFSIAPAYWQTAWFRATCLVSLLFLLTALYHWRLRQIRGAFNARLEERVGERTRIARDLHDTLLQSFLGLLLRFQTARDLLRARPEEAEQVLDRAIRQAEQAITEGRKAVQGLRASTLERNDLARAITSLAQDIEAETGDQGAAELRVSVEGVPRILHPIVRDEIYRIGGEALRNAFRHAEAKTIEIELRYDPRSLRLRIRDDGRGIDPQFLAARGREGHFGLHGMRERATLIGGKLIIWAARDSGTEIELRVPASRAYRGSPSHWRSWFTKRFSRGATDSGDDEPSKLDSDPVD